MATLGRPRTGSLTPVDLVDAVRSGTVRIPEFQRPYKWQASDVVLLFDSLRRGFPIGNLLFWRRPAPAATVHLGPFSVDAPEVAEANWVIDGQQRIISITGALTAADDVEDLRLRIVLDVETEEFRAVAAPYDTEPTWLPISRLLDTKRLLAWFRENSEWLSDSQISTLETVAATIRDYQIPTYTVTGEDEGELRLIFDRMNTSGRPMTQAEVFQALHMDETSPNIMRDLADEVADLGFGRLYETTALRCLRAFRGMDVLGDPHDELWSARDQERALRGATEAFAHVIAFLRTEVGVPHRRALPYQKTLYPLIRFAARYGPIEGRPAELLRRWAWRDWVVNSNRRLDLPRKDEMSSITGTADQAAASLLASAPAWRPSTSISINRPINRKIVQLVQLAQEPRDLEVGSILDHAALFDDYDDPWPKIVADDDKRAGFSTANRIFQQHAPSAQLVERLLSATAEVLDSHLMDEEAVSYLRDGDEVLFLERRSSLLDQVFQAHVDRMAEWGARDGRSVRDVMRSGRAS